MIMTLIPIGCKAQAPQSDIQTAIIGTWLAEDEPGVKLVFNSDGTYKTYYDNELTGTYSFSHQCGSESDKKA